MVLLVPSHNRMSFAPSALDTGFELGTKPGRLRIPVAEEDIFRIAVLGCFRGSGAPAAALRHRQPLRVDYPVFDSLFQRLAPTLSLDVPGLGPITLAFERLRDFHPDRLWLGPACADLQAALTASLGETPPDLTARLRHVMNDPAWRALEASWRGLAILAERLAHIPALEIHLFDVSREELVADLTADADIQDTGLYNLLAGPREYSLIVADYSFGASLDDLALLHPLGRIGKHAAAPVIAAAETPDEGWTADCPVAWREFQDTAAASWVALTYPRFLTRLPFGSRQTPCELVDFEEVETPPGSAHLCWGNAAYLCAVVIGQAFVEGGDCFHPGFLREVEGLPTYLFESNATLRGHPCSEALLDHRTTVSLLERGLIPVLAEESPGSVRILEFQAVNRDRLTGRWGMS